MLTSGLSRSLPYRFSTENWYIRSIASLRTEVGPSDIVEQYTISRSIRFCSGSDFIIAKLEDGSQPQLHFALNWTSWIATILAHRELVKFDGEEVIPTRKAGRDAVEYMSPGEFSTRAQLKRGGYKDPTS